MGVRWPPFRGPGAAIEGAVALHGLGVRWPPPASEGERFLPYPLAGRGWPTNPMAPTTPGQRGGKELLCFRHPVGALCRWACLPQSDSPTNLYQVYLRVRGIGVSTICAE